MGDKLGQLPTDDFERFRQDAELNELLDYLKAINLPELAKKVQEDHFAARISEFQRVSDHLSLALELHNLKEDRLLDDVKAINADVLNQGVNYHNVIAGLGYAGFIAILGILKSEVFQGDFLVASIFFSISLMSFVIWTSLMGYLFARSVSKVAPMFEMPKDELDRRVIIEKFNEAARAREDSYTYTQRFWGVSFIVSLIGGAAATIVIVASLCFKLVGATGGFIDFILRCFDL